MPKKPEYPYGSITPPLYRGVAFAAHSIDEAARAFSEYGSRYAYGRMGNPSVEPFEKWFAEFEGVPVGSMWAYCSGMAAIKHLIEGITSKDVGRGKRVVASPYLYGGTYHLLEWLARNEKIDLVWVENPFQLSSWEKEIRACNPALVLLETPSNPSIDIFDIKALAHLAKEQGSRLVVDNTMGIGLQRPIDLGADGAVYSATKAMNGKSTDLGGALVVSPNFRKEIEETLDDLFVSSGIGMSPDSALAIFANRTTLRRHMRIFSQNALHVATFLERHPRVKKVNYPMLLESPHFELAQRQMPDGGGGVLSFVLGATKKQLNLLSGRKKSFLPFIWEMKTTSF